MIAVVGCPRWRAGSSGAPAGLAASVALAAARRGATVELVGRVGDDPAGDALLLALSAAGVRHAAVLRDGAATPLVEPLDEEAEGPIGVSPAEPLGGAGGSPSAASPAAAHPRLDPEDVALGLRYLTDFGVLVVTDDVPAEALPVAIDAAQYAGAQLVVLVGPAGPGPAALPEGATALAVPDTDDLAAFGDVVGAYAAALDAGGDPADAFRAATGTAGWEAVESDA